MLYRRAIQLEESAGKLHSETLLIGSGLLLVLGEFEECGRMIERAAKVALRLTKGNATDRRVHFLLVQAYRATGKLRALDQVQKKQRHLTPWHKWCHGRRAAGRRIIDLRKLRGTTCATVSYN